MPYHSSENNVMTQIFNKYNTDKNESFHNYPYFYNRYLLEYRQRPSLKYLEIGVFRGESLKGMREYFNNAHVILGIDVDPATKQYEDTSNGVYVELGNQTDTHFLKSVNDKHGGFDVILDDGSHLYSDIITSFKCLFPLLNNGGVYVIEDTICIRDQLQYFHSLTHQLNHWRQDVGGDNCVDPFKINLKVSDPIIYSISDIVFTNSAIILYKDVKSNWICNIL